MDDTADPLRLPVVVAYADKRVRHADIVSVQERFDDLMVRYGTDEEKREMLAENLAHSLAVEQAIFDRVGVL